MNIEEKSSFQEKEEPALDIPAPEKNKLSRDERCKIAKDMEEILDEIMAEIEEEKKKDADREAFDEEDDGDEDFEPENDFEDEEELPGNIITLSDNYGEETEFELLDLVELGEKEYIVLIPHEKEPEEEGVEVVILEVGESDGEAESYIGIEDADVLQEVYEIFKEKNKHLYNFTD